MANSTETKDNTVADTFNAKLQIVVTSHKININGVDRILSNISYRILPFRDHKGVEKVIESC